MDKDICPECNGQGYSLNDIHYLSDADDYERRYLSCRRCNGTGRYYKIEMIIKFWTLCDCKMLAKTPETTKNI